MVRRVFAAPARHRPSKRPSRAAAAADVIENAEYAWLASIGPADLIVEMNKDITALGGVKITEIVKWYARTHPVTLTLTLTCAGTCTARTGHVVGVQLASGLSELFSHA